MDSAIYPRPLLECGIAIVEALIKEGKADKCGDCGKPFHVARKWQSVARVTICNETGETHTWSWLLCRKCTHDAKQKGGKTPPHLMRQAIDEAALLMAEPRGTA